MVFDGIDETSNYYLFLKGICKSSTFFSTFRPSVVSDEATEVLFDERELYN